MQGDIDFVTIPDGLHGILGTPELKTRIYKREGTQEEVGHWFDMLTNAVGPTINPGAVRMYVPVSRAALYERILRGRLSMFQFDVIRRTTNLFGKDKTVRERPYAFVPVSECRSWRQLIEGRAMEKGFATKEEIENAKPEWVDEFLDWERDKDDEADKARADTLSLNLTAFETGYLKTIADEMKLDSSAVFAQELIKRLVAGDFSALTFIKTGFWISSGMVKSRPPSMTIALMAEQLQRDAKRKLKEEKK